MEKDKQKCMYNKFFEVVLQATFQRGALLRSVATHPDNNYDVTNSYSDNCFLRSSKTNENMPKPIFKNKLSAIIPVSRAATTTDSAIVTLNKKSIYIICIEYSI